MEHQKAKRAEIQERIYQAKTVEELLAIATEAGETLTPEDAAKLLQEVEAERAKATAKKEFQSADDLTDEELAKVVGGAIELITQNMTPRISFREMTYQSGLDIILNHSARDLHCQYWICEMHRIKHTRVERTEVTHGTNLTEKCALCDDTVVMCKRCGYRIGQGLFARDHCTCPEVRRSYGLAR